MKLFGMAILVFGLVLPVVRAADAPPATAASILDGDVGSAEREIVSLAEAVPADKYEFAPTSGEFKGVRTFGAQMRHIATVNYSVSASLLGEKAPVDLGDGDNGLKTMVAKDEIVKYLKGSFAYAHRGVATVTPTNLTESLTAFGDSKMPRLALATIIAWHSFDHYGQAVVYARMNGIVPPASRK